MEGLLPATPFANLVAARLGSESFTLLDIGCGGGVDNAWRCFGPKLRAIAIDPNIAEIDRLRAAEKNAGIEYIAAFVGLPESHELAKPMAEHGFWRQNPWQRLSAYRSIELQQNSINRMSDVEKVGVNAWRHTKLAEGSPIHLPRLLSDRKIQDVDFVKIDVDGPDYIILQSLKESFDSTNLLGIGIEVNFCGGTHPFDNTFHNVDRFMRENGFDLFALTTRKYSGKALPAPYLLSVPAQSTYGRPFQGDALYLRDVAAPYCGVFAEKLSPEKLVKLACIFSLTGLPDCAAEILVAFRDRIKGVLDIDQGLDLLTAQTELGQQHELGYRNYMQLFDQDSPLFYSHAHRVKDTNDGAERPAAKKRSGWLKRAERFLGKGWKKSRN